MKVTPENPLVESGDTQQFSCDAEFVEWRLGGNSDCSIDPSTGLFTAGVEGQTIEVIAFRFDGTKGTTVVTTTAAD
jgi:hypothetical protein